MKKGTLLIALLAIASFIPACNKDKPAAVEAAKPAAAAAEAPAAAPAEAPTAEQKAAAADAVGIAECDEYITKYSACINKMPAEAQAGARDALKQMADGWRTAATSPEAKAAMAPACQQALAAAKEAMSAFGCEW